MTTAAAFAPGTEAKTSVRDTPKDRIRIVWTSGGDETPSPFPPALTPKWMEQTGTLRIDQPEADLVASAATLTQTLAQLPIDARDEALLDDLARTRAPTFSKALKPSKTRASK